MGSSPNTATYKPCNLEQASTTRLCLSALEQGKYLPPLSSSSIIERVKLIDVCESNFKILEYYTSIEWNIYTANEIYILQVASAHS